jgi:hypothetical protein
VVLCSVLTLNAPTLRAIAASGACTPRVSRLSSGLGEPDDLAVVGGRLLFGDLKTGAVAEIIHGRPKIVVADLDVPEGIVDLSGHRILVVEQGRNRIDRIDLRTGRRAVLKNLVNKTGNEGVDNIASIRGHVVVPDSPYGTVLRLSSGRLTTIARGLRRPTGVAPFAGGMAVADEYGNAIWLLKHGSLSKLASLPTPDDVATAHGILLAVTLGDGGLWEIRPRLRRLVNLFNQPQGLVTIGARSVDVSSQNQNVIDQVTLPKDCFG